MAEKGKNNFKYCLVPCCKNTSVTAPDKVFINVPKDPAVRTEWLKAMKRDEEKNPPLSAKTTRVCCEDHFSLEDDLENYCRWKLSGKVDRLRLKKGILPHKFECQKKPHTPPVRKGALKRKRFSLVQEALSSIEVPSSSQSEPSETIAEAVEFSESGPSSSTCDTPTVEHKAIQANIVKKFRSKGTSTQIPMNSIACSPIKVIKYECPKPPLIQDSPIKEEDSDDSDFQYNESQEDNYSDEEDIDTEQFKTHMLRGTIMSIEKNPKLFLGLPLKSYFLLIELHEAARIPMNDIFLTLKKLKVNSSLAILAIDFGISESTASRRFRKSVPKLAQLLQELIVWPAAEAIEDHMPLAFQARYSGISSIIDCFEIEIEKPSNAMHQSLTWSSYYNCNTVKYLISMTPDGLVNFVSEGFGGRTSDALIVEHSGYLEKLVPGSSIMADRGFRHISSMLTQKGVSLIRPPSVASGSIISLPGVRVSKQIASLRIHIERAIGRVREFKMLTPHSCVDNHLIPYLDYLVIIACGIINMQDHLIQNQMY